MKSDNAIQEKAGKTEVEVPEGVERIVSRKAYVPDVDVIENEAGLVLLADMPGVTNDSVEVVLEKNILTVKGKPKSAEIPGYSLTYSEYGVGDFERAFTLSEEVDREKIDAVISDGVLRITLSRSAPSAKRIAVTAK